MFAILKTGGKQYKVSNGDSINVENLNLEEGQEVSLNDILMISGDDGSISFNKGLVKATVVSNFRGEKVIAFKKRRRHTYKRKKGHRQYLTKIKIISIEAN